MVLSGPFGPVFCRVDGLSSTVFLRLPTLVNVYILVRTAICMLKRYIFSIPFSKNVIALTILYTDSITFIIIAQAVSFVHA